jgi:hypothetical protein
MVISTSFEFGGSVTGETCRPQTDLKAWKGLVDIWKCELSCKLGQ